MKIDDKYYIKKDANNVILCFEEEGDINEKTGKPIQRKEEWYYKDLKDALRAYFHKSIDPNQDMKLLMDRMNEVERNIEKATA